MVATGHGRRCLDHDQAYKIGKPKGADSSGNHSASRQRRRLAFSKGYGILGVRIGRGHMKLLIAFATAALITAPAISAGCRGAGGKFVKCPPPASASVRITKDANGKCHAAGGKFVACPK